MRDFSKSLQLMKTRLVCTSRCANCHMTKGVGPGSWVLINSIPLDYLFSICQ